MDWVRLELNAAADFLRHLFTYIFPEYPTIGVIVGALSALTFFYYLFKSGPIMALKMGGSGFIGAVLVLFIIHHLALLFGLNYRF